MRELEAIRRAFSGQLWLLWGRYEPQGEGKVFREDYVPLSPKGALQFNRMVPWDEPKKYGIPLGERGRDVESRR